jgi:hypothetical protein
MAMRWEDEPYVRLYKKKTITWKMLPWQAKVVLRALLTEVDRAGLLELGEHGVEGLAALLELPLDIVEVGLPSLLKTKTLELAGPTRSTLLWPSFIEAQETPSSDAQRKRDERERARARTRLAALTSGTVDPGTVYFIRAEGGGPVKIGHTTGKLADRLSAIQAGHPDKLRVVHSEPGSLEREKDLHRQFASHRRNGEWFEWAPEIQAYVTKRDASVTHGHAASRDVTGGHSDPDLSSADQDRAEQNTRTDARVRVDGSETEASGGETKVSPPPPEQMLGDDGPELEQPAFALEPDPPPKDDDLDLGKPQGAEQRKVVDRWLDESLAVLEALNQARKRAIPNARGIRPTYVSLHKIAERLEARHTRDECMAVIEQCELAIRAGDDRGREYFDSISPFRAENFERKLAMPPPTPGSARASPNLRLLPLSSSVNDQSRELIRGVWK